MLIWKLKSYLDAHDITAYRLAQTADLSATTVYALARGKHERISLEVLDKVLGSLEKLSGKPVTLDDVLERQPDPEPTDAETKAWLEADLDPDLEAYDWGADGLPEGEPVRYVEGQGWVVGETKRA